MGHKGPRKRNPSRSRYHRNGLRTSRKRDDYTPASEVTVIDADSGEVIDTLPALGEKQYERIVAKGHKRSDPSRRAITRRNYAEEA